MQIPGLVRERVVDFAKIDVHDGARPVIHGQLQRCDSTSPCGSLSESERKDYQLGRFSSRQVQRQCRSRSGLLSVQFRGLDFGKWNNELVDNESRSEERRVGKE